jgi:hypothetical protein
LGSLARGDLDLGRLPNRIALALADRDREVEQADQFLAQLARGLDPADRCACRPADGTFGMRP